MAKRILPFISSDRTFWRNTLRSCALPRHPPQRIDRREHALGRGGRVEQGRMAIVREARDGVANGEKDRDGEHQRRLAHPPRGGVCRLGGGGRGPGGGRAKG